MSTDPREIDLEIRTHATPEEVWRAWAEPTGVAAWFVDSAEGEAQEGNTITWFFTRHFQYALPYHVLEAVPGERLRLGPPPGGPPFVLDIRITRDAGDTVIRLVNSGFTTDARFEEEYQGIVSGWRMALATLKEYLERYQGETRSSALAVVPAEYALTALLPWYTDGARLRSWLGATDGIGPVGSVYRLALPDGTIATGEVLAVTPWEVCLSWRERRGVLQLKGFRQSGASKLCMQVSVWGAEPITLETTETWMRSALGRLAEVIRLRS